MPHLSLSHLVSEDIVLLLKEWFPVTKYKCHKKQMNIFKLFAVDCKVFLQNQFAKENWYSDIPESVTQQLRKKIEVALSDLLTVKSYPQKGNAERHKQHILEAILVAILLREWLLKWELESLKVVWEDVTVKSPQCDDVCGLIEEQKNEPPKKRKRKNSDDTEEAFAFFIVACEVCRRMGIVPANDKKTVWMYALGLLEPVSKRYVSGGQPTSATKRRDKVFQIITGVEATPRVLRNFFLMPELFETFPSVAQPVTSLTPLNPTSMEPSIFAAPDVVTSISSWNAQDEISSVDWSKLELPQNETADFEEENEDVADMITDTGDDMSVGSEETRSFHGDVEDFGNDDFDFDFGDNRIPDEIVGSETSSLETEIIETPVVGREVGLTTIDSHHADEAEERVAKKMRIEKHENFSIGGIDIDELLSEIEEFLSSAREQEY